MQRKAKVYIIVPITIPGMKKESFYQSLESIVNKLGYRYSYIANKFFKDKCKKEMIKGRFQSEEEYKRNIDFKAKELFQKHFRDLIKQTELSPLIPHFIYVEKNHPPGSWNGTQKLINKVKGSLEIKVIGLVPKVIGEPFYYKEGKKTVKYPFSNELFFTCLDRVQKREDHETLAGNGAASIKVLLEFLNFFREISLTHDFLGNHGFCKLIYAPFTRENNPITIPPELNKALIDALEGVDTSREAELLEKLNNIYENCNIKFNDPDIEAIEKEIYLFLENEMLFKSTPQKKILPSQNEIKENRAITDQTLDKCPREEIKKEGKIQEKAIQNEESKNSISTETKAQKDKEINQEEKKEDQIEKVLEINYKKKKAKIPELLGVFPKSLEEIKDKSLKALQERVQFLPQDKSLQYFLEDFQKDVSLIKFVENPHLVALYINQNKEMLKTSFYKGFPKDITLTLDIFGFILIQNKLLIALCDYDTSLFKIQDKYPHMTLVKEESILDESENILINLFEEENSFSQKYKFQELKSAEKFVEKVIINLCDKYETIYIFKTSKIELLAETKEK